MKARQFFFSVVFAGFSADALVTRIEDSKFIIFYLKQVFPMIMHLVLV